MDCSLKKGTPSLKCFNWIFITVLLVQITSLTSCINKPTSTSFADFDESISFNEFINPSNTYRSHPFYSINDSLSAEEITRQILDFKQAGFGGFYLHSRIGLLTPFLGNEWWKMMQAAVDAGKSAGLNTNFYDEDKWPSGYAGGIIPNMSDEYKAKHLVRLKKETPLPQGSELLKTDSTYQYILYTVPMGNPKFNGTCWVDLLNPEMVQAFIKVSYQPYVDKYKEQLPGKTFNIFADEPHIHARYFDKETPNEGVLSYSPWVRKRFNELYGYDIIDKAELLFEDKDNWREVRLQYYQAIAKQFEASFTKQISDFSKKNGINFTGHYLGEDVIKKVRDRIGNSMMHYRNMQIPGIDHLGLGIEKRLITAKSLSSVANQYNKTKRLSELFGISGQNMNFEDRKWIAGWHAILGINHFCPHLTLYSLKGARKRDYPPTFSYHQPYWKQNKIIEDYLARIAYATSIGHFKPQLLVIHPLESEYIRSNSESQYTKPLLSTLQQLQEMHIDYDLGDEQIMSDTAFVKDGQLIIGTMQYSNILLPDMKNIRTSTIELLLDLKNSGGKIFNCGEFPTYIDGALNDSLLNQLKSATTFIDKNEFSNLSNQHMKPNAHLTGEQAEKIWIQTRSSSEGNLIQFYNSSHTDKITIKVTSALLENQPVLWDPSKVKCFTLDKDEEGFTIELEASSNIWITSGELSKKAIIEGNYTIDNPEKQVVILNSKWNGKPLNENALTLDFAQFSTDQGNTFSSPEPIIGIYEQLSEKEYRGDLILKYSATINDIPDSCHLVMEQPHIYKNIEVNSQNIVFNTNKYYLDHQFPVAEITHLLKKGNNTILLSINFEPQIINSTIASERYGTEIESIYLTGNFGLKSNNCENTMDTQRNLSGDFQKRPAHGFNSFIITSQDDVYDGNLTLEGFPFYAGSFSLSQTFSMDSVDSETQYTLQLPNCEAIAMQVLLNGDDMGTLCWSPYTLNITKSLKSGENQITIILTNSLRNLLGPHHQPRGESIKVGPYSFTGAGGFPDGQGDANWYELRKARKPLKYWTDNYFMIPFGFIEPVTILANK